LQFTFQSFWHFLGVLALLGMVVQGVQAIVLALLSR
jgi:hypothetical protein